MIRLFSIILNVFLVTTVAAQAPVLGVDEFIVKPKTVAQKPLQIGELREEIALVAQGVLQQSNNVLASLGRVHCALAAGSEGKKGGEQPIAYNDFKKHTACNKASGLLQQDLATLQQLCAQSIEKVFRKNRVFKAAKRPALEGALTGLSNLNEALEQAASDLETLAKQNKKPGALESISTKLAQHQTAIHTALQICRQNECLKQV
jgi:hypothetical protein